jgi:16S rRNA (adenine1518-N6/adenine1519-N6)-dimethyltransferase
LFTSICEQHRSFLTTIHRLRTAPAKPSETAAVLREIGVSPVKSLGQNFLHDRNLSRWIVEQIGATNGDYVVEIGPGLGALTGPLLQTGARVLALEKDRRLAEFLGKHFPGDRFDVRHLDALDFDVRTLFAEPTVKLIGNLPYYISSQLLLKFLEYPSPISLAVLMLQKEMAERICARPGTKDYGALSVLIQRHYYIKLVRRVPTAVFIPRPEVDSAVVRIAPRRPGELPDYDDELFSAIVRRAFSQRRKQLGNLIADYVKDWGAAAQTLGLDPKARAETLSLDQWIALTNYIRPIRSQQPVSEAEESFPVVDNSDHFLHSAPRAKVHGDNLRHRAVHILVFNKSGEVYLQKRSRWKDRHPGLWDSSAAGHVLAGEEYDHAAQRELREELGIEALLERIVKLPASERTGQEFIWLYCARCDGEILPNRYEIELGRYFQPAIVTGWIASRPGDFAPGFIECWKAYLDRCR